MLGFLVAPLWAPAAAVFMAVIQGNSAIRQAGSILSTAILSYVLAFAVGFPLLRLTRRRGRRVTLWLLIATGAMAGAGVYAVFLTITWLRIRHRFSVADDPWAGNADVFVMGTALLGSLGALTGSTYWRIARPDRASPAQVAEQF